MSATVRIATERGDRAGIARSSRYMPMVGVLWLVALPGAAQTWVPTDVHPNVGVTSSVASAISDTGIVVGSTDRPSAWTSLGNPWEISGCREANAINKTSQIAATCFDGSSYRAVQWHPAWGFSIGTLGGPNSWAKGINNAGHVVGYSDLFSNSPHHAFFWSFGPNMLDLGTLGGDSSEAFDVNDVDQVVGAAQTAEGNWHAFLWSADTGMADLGTLGGLNSRALGINNLGQVVGWAEVTEGYSHAFLWESGTMTDLGTLPGRTGSYATGINESGAIVGYSVDDQSSGSSRAFFRRAGGPMMDLGTLGGNESAALGINDSGQVAGWADGATFVQHATIWNGLWKDLVVHFGSDAAIWTLRQTTWLRLTYASAKPIVSGDFDGNGLDDLAIDLSLTGVPKGVWLWMNHTYVNWLYGLSPTTMAVGDFDHNGKSDLVLSIAGQGLYAWMNNATWQFLSSFEATRMAVGDLDGDGSDELIVDVPGSGLWAVSNNTTWQFLTSQSVTTMTAVDVDGNGKAELVASFPGYGIYIFSNNSSWTFLNPSEAKVIAAGQLDAGSQADLVIDFGPTYGIWTYRNSTSWSQVSWLSSAAIVVADFDGDWRDEIVISFGTAGLWRYSATASNPWTFLSGATASTLVASRIH